MLNKNRLLGAAVIGAALLGGCTERGPTAPNDAASAPERADNPPQRDVAHPSSATPATQASDTPLQPWERKLDARLLRAASKPPIADKAWPNTPALQVIVIANDASAIAMLQREVEAAGGTVRTHFQNRLYAELPASAIEPVAQLPAVWSMQVDNPLIVPQSETAP